MDRKHCTDDTLQEASLAAGKAVRTWDPAKGEFSTWIITKATSAIRDHVRRERSGPVGGRDAYGATSKWVEEVIPDGRQKSVLNLMVEERDKTELRNLVGHLRSEADKEIVALRFGLERFPAMRMQQIAQQVGLSLATVERRLANALAEMRGFAERSRQLPNSKEKVA